MSSGVSAPIVQGANSTAMQQLLKGRNTTAQFLAKITGANGLDQATGPQADGVNPDGSVHYDGSTSAIAALAAQAKAAAAGVPTATSPATLASTIGSDKSLAQQAVQAKVAAGAKGGGAALAFAAALKLAEKEAGPFNASPFADAIGADTSAAGTARTEAQQNAANAEGDDAALYGRLGNYIKQIAAAGRQGTKQSTSEVTGDYNQALRSIGSTYGNVNAAGNKELSRLGLAPNVAGATGGSEAAAIGASETGKANARADVQGNGDAFNRLMGQTQADVAATGTGKVADEKAALNTALENIASTLNSQVASAHGSEATAQAAYESQMRTLAGQIEATQTANNPNSLDNLTKAANLAKIYAETEVEQGKIPGAPGTAITGNLSGQKGYANAIAQLAAQATAGVAKGGIDPTHLGTLESFLQSIEAGGQGAPVTLNAGGSSPVTPVIAPFQFNTANQGTALADATKLIKAAGYSSTDQAALDTAIRMLLGQE